MSELQKKTIITIAGKPGSGKSSTANELARKLDYQRFSSGDFMRKIAIDRGIDLNALSAIAENDPSIDTAIDAEVKKAGLMDQLVIDSRLAFHWIPNSFKVYLDLPAEIAKERVLKSLKTDKLRQESEASTNTEDIYNKIISRLESEKKRYMELYGIDHTNLNNFDLVIDTSQRTVDDVVDQILTQYKTWLGK